MDLETILQRQRMLCRALENPMLTRYVRVLRHPFICYEEFYFEGDFKSRCDHILRCFAKHEDRQIPAYSDVEFLRIDSQMAYLWTSIKRCPGLKVLEFSGDLIALLISPFPGAMFGTSISHSTAHLNESALTTLRSECSRIQELRILPYKTPNTHGFDIELCLELLQEQLSTPTVLISHLSAPFPWHISSRQIRTITTLILTECHAKVANGLEILVGSCTALTNLRIEWAN
jgi:hypothetical protein